MRDDLDCVLLLKRRLTVTLSRVAAVVAFMARSIVSILQVILLATDNAAADPNPPPLAHIAVFSQCGHAAIRAAIRNSWGADAVAASLSITFFVPRGREECPLELLNDEDIDGPSGGTFHSQGLGVDDAQLDTARALLYGPRFLTDAGAVGEGPYSAALGATTPALLTAAFAWLISHPRTLRNASFIVKADDGVALHVPALLLRFQLLHAVAADQHSSHRTFAPPERGGSPLPYVIYGSWMEGSSGAPFHELAKGASHAAGRGRWDRAVEASGSLTIVDGTLSIVLPTEIGGGTISALDAQTAARAPGVVPCGALFAVSTSVAIHLAHAGRWLQTDAFVTDAAAVAGWTATYDVLRVHDADALVATSEDAGRRHSPHLAVLVGADPRARAGRAATAASLSFPLHLVTLSAAHGEGGGGSINGIVPCIIGGADGGTAGDLDPDGGESATATRSRMRGLFRRGSVARRGGSTASATDHSAVTAPPSPWTMHTRLARLASRLFARFGFPRRSSSHIPYDADAELDAATLSGSSGEGEARRIVLYDSLLRTKVAARTARMAAELLRYGNALAHNGSLLG